MDAEPPLVRELRDRIQELQRINADLQRQVEELRGAVAVLTAPAPSELSENFTH